MVVPESYVDINVFVYWLGNHPDFGKIAYQWIKKIENVPKGKYITSSLTLYQVAVIMAGLTGRNLKDKELVEEIVNPITSLPGLIVSPLTSEDVSKAVSLMREYDLDYEDSLHLAVAIRNKVKEIISNDQDFDKTPLKRKFL
ncbi:MAG: type II toxin-antitoxin system VapC family toxin [Thermoprotei archaeon]|jgi:predicted nucleic acid-binding protein